MNKNLLLSKIILFGETQAVLAREIGLSTTRLNAKINENNGAEFTQSEIRKIKERYQLTNDEVNEIFFDYKCL